MVVWSLWWFSVHGSLIYLVSVVISGHRNEYEAFADDLKSAPLWLYTQPASCKRKRKFVITYQGSSVGT